MGLMKTMIGKVSHDDLMWGDSSDCLPHVFLLKNR